MAAQASKASSQPMDLILTGSQIATFVKMLSLVMTSVCHLLAIFVIAAGVTKALVIFLRELLLKAQTPEAFERSRLAMGYAFSLGLSFLVGASILQTIISSQWDDIARLTAIIAVRTVLNYLLFQFPSQNDSSLIWPQVAITSTDASQKVEDGKEGAIAASS
jgi:uncharacterized membrane protein